MKTGKDSLSGGIRVGLVFVLMLALIQPVVALVSPDETDLEVASWYAQLLVLNSTTMEVESYCKGALIAPQWVLTASSCVVDPFKRMDDSQEPPGEGVLFIRFGNSETLVEVEEFVSGEFYGAALVRLKAPVSHPFLSLGYYAPEDLEDKNVVILGNESSRVVGDSLLNKNIGSKVNCYVGTSLIYDIETSTLCYVLSKRTASDKFFRIEPTVVNPSDYEISSSMDDFGEYDSQGSYLFLEFADSRTMPCHEDIGAPLLQDDGKGGYEIVGVVTGVGMAAGYTNCNYGFNNYYWNIRASRGFLEKSMAQSYFDALCPDKPALDFEIISDTQVSLSWESQEGATGHLLHYSPWEGYEPFTTLDTGLATEHVMELEQYYEYTMTLSAYSQFCIGPMSDPKIVFLPYD